MQIYAFKLKPIKACLKIRHNFQIPYDWSEREKHAFHTLHNPFNNFQRQLILRNKQKIY
jgi:hypothetical protein